MTRRPPSFNQRLTKITRSPRGRGRPPTPAARPIMARHGLERFLAGDAKIIEAMRLRDGGFEMMVRAGMTPYQIARAIGVHRAMVYHWIDQMNLPRRKLTRTEAPAVAVVRRHSESGGRRRSVLLG